jgi:hypothetical protein
MFHIELVYYTPLLSNCHLQTRKYQNETITRVTSRFCLNLCRSRIRKTDRNYLRLLLTISHFTLWDSYLSSGSQFQIDIQLSDPPFHAQRASQSRVRERKFFPLTACQKVSTDVRYKFDRTTSVASHYHSL